MTTHLEILYWNYGIPNNINELAVLTSTYKLYIILISETYPIRGSPALGGTALLVRCKIVHQQIPLNTNLQCSSITYDKTHLISLVYKPPSSALDPFDIDRLISSADNVIITGDLNAKPRTEVGIATHLMRQILSTLYNELQQNDYSALAIDTPTHFPYSARYRSVLIL